MNEELILKNRLKEYIEDRFKSFGFKKEFNYKFYVLNYKVPIIYGSHGYTELSKRQHLK